MDQKVTKIHGHIKSRKKPCFCEENREKCREINENRAEMPISVGVRRR